MPNNPNSSSRNTQHLTRNTKSQNDSLSPELKFLIACCQINPSAKDINFILSYLNTAPSGNALGVQPSTLNALIPLANQHGILPLIYKTIKNLQPDNSSIQHFLPELKANYQSIVQRNMLMSAELIKIMQLLKENSIEALAFKGPTLSQMAYGDITLRQYSDLDILVEEKNLYQVAELIIAQNYEPMDSIEFLNKKAKLHVEKNYEFYGRENGIKIEIHWQLINSSFLKKFKSYDVFTTPQEIKINQTLIPTLNTEILLLYLCNHGASHMWERLEWVLDIDRLIASQEASLNWDNMLQLASSLQSKTTILLGLGLSSELFGTKLPSNIHTLLDNRQISNLIRSILDTFNSDLLDKDHTSHKKNLKVFLFHLTLQDSLATKAGFILQTLFGYSDGDVMMVNLPQSLFFLYYPLRIGRIIYKYTLKPLKNVFVKFSQ